MPDFVLMAESLLVAAIVAGLALLVIARPASPSPWRVATGWVAGLGAGIYGGCGWLGELPRWPPLEDRDRFLVILLPLALAVEGAAMLIKPRWPIWIARIAVAAAAAPILLYNSSYIADLDGDGPGSAEWNRAETALVLSLSAVMLAGVWGLLGRLKARDSDRALSPVLVFTALASGVTVMLCGYFRGGRLALPIAGAIAGVTLASYAFPKQQVENPCLGIGIIGIFTIRFIGRFYGSLPTSLAIGLLLAPLLAWTAELPWFRKLPPAARATIGIAAVLAALALIVTYAQLRFNAAAQGL